MSFDPFRQIATGYAVFVTVSIYAEEDTLQKWSVSSAHNDSC